jgi:hypothetical protein
MAARLANPAAGRADADALWVRARPVFSLDAMAGSVFDAYCNALGLGSAHFHEPAPPLHNSGLARMPAE